MSRVVQYDSLALKVALFADWKASSKSNIEIIMNNYIIIYKNKLNPIITQLPAAS